MISVLRLGHRVGRDHRISTHCCLVARAFGADRLYYSGQRDTGMEDSVNKAVKNWGGKFAAEFVPDWKKFIRGFPGNKVHLTAYGLSFEKEIKKIRKHKGLLVIIGGEKVPPEIYQLADWNISVTSQPHSEIAALAVFLDRLFDGNELDKKYSKARVKVIPQERGKKTIISKT